ncbi:hypothetical protein GLV94_12105 [Virgibacillus halodenitrificans]|uniref:Uncharacterized protein n=1 Tax=Virgibacillus halodenitrificans TaxID=1482 RepID=A0AAC9IZ67_VIRHA|nr:hypothetical protein [Virgibacillus halodenitrificans]APC47667.1 hypothetical protein BME96_05575 [Virgibacillus halodenitrificans]MCJ0930509.1 hypothetical protein [Virgibacillus halodenitrificans]MYL46387.1 hypothetical protein [Virgibacillus halodenitrificans]MYL56250.1 hypothetical protein [Virgibacillus halodenitrificans]WHX24499.1 hypothetical protein QNH47_09835 [Virgibacillus halodenitrificans]
MSNVGLLLIGLSLLTLVMVIILSRVAEAIFIISNYVGDIIPYFVYVLIGIVFLFGVTLVLLDKRR